MLEKFVLMLMVTLTCSCAQTSEGTMKIDCVIYEPVYAKNKAEAVIISKLSVAQSIEKNNAVYESRCPTVNSPIY